MEIYQVMNRRGDVVESFMIKKLAEVFMADCFDKDPDDFFYIESINTKDGEYDEDSYLNKKIHYGVVVIFDSKTMDCDGIREISSLKPISNKVEEVYRSYEVTFEIDENAYSQISGNDYFCYNSDLGKILQKKAIDIFEDFKKKIFEEE